VPSLIGFSESGLGHLASRIADDFARSGQRRQTLSPSSASQLGVLLACCACLAFCRARFVTCSRQLVC